MFWGARRCTRRRRSGSHHLTAALLLGRSLLGRSRQFEERGVAGAAGRCRYRCWCRRGSGVPRHGVLLGTRVLLGARALEFGGRSVPFEVGKGMVGFLPCRVRRGDDDAKLCFFGTEGHAVALRWELRGFCRR